MTNKGKANLWACAGSLVGCFFVGVGVFVTESTSGGWVGAILSIPFLIVSIKKATKYHMMDDNIQQPSTQPMHDETKSIDANKQKSTHQAQKEMVKDVQKRIADTAYISNLRIGRSWVLPQMIEMCFKGDKFSKHKYLEAVETLDYEKGWRILLRNMRVISLYNDKADEYRSGWWTKEVVLAMAKNDLRLLKSYINELSISPRENCSGGPYIRIYSLRSCKNKQDQMYFIGNVNPNSKWYGKGKEIANLYKVFENRINEIEQSQTSKQLYNAIKDYDNHRCVFAGWSKTPALPKEFENAFIGDGAFTSMMTLVKFLNLCYKDENGDMLTREQCIEEIENKALECAYDGEQMFAYLAEKFFDVNAGGVFEINAYRMKAN